MGLFFRPHRPLARLVAEAATAGVAYRYGVAAGERVGDERHDSFSAVPREETTYAPPNLGPAGPSPYRTEDLEHLVALHDSGTLADDEFSALKARILGLGPRV